MTSSDTDLCSPKSVNISEEEEHGLSLLSSACARLHRLKKGVVVQREEQRVSCHRCGNIRKNKTICTNPSGCPHIFCGRCTAKMKEEYGDEAFFRGCPVCRGLCCCSNKTTQCSRKNHCYRKCPATKTTRLPSRNAIKKRSAAAALDCLADLASVAHDTQESLSVVNTSSAITDEELPAEET